MAGNEVLITVKSTGADQVSRDFDEVEKKAKGFGDVLGKVGTIAGGFLAANVIQGGVQKLTGFIGDSIGAVKESIAVNAQLDAVLKSTGGAAGVVASAVRDQASALEKASLFEDEAILKGQNLLLTFTNIGKDVFPRATQSMVDMGQAMGTDASGAAIQLGKALNDPVKGITALTRVGVSFTDEQKEQIKTMQEAGNIAGAQAIILAELEKEFGGSAKAASDAAGASEVYKDRMNDLKEQIGSKMLPVQELWMKAQTVAVSFIADKLIPALEVLYAKHWPAIEQAINNVVDVFQQHWPIISAVLQAWWEFTKARIEGFVQLVSSIVEIVTSTVNLVSDLFHGRWSEAWGEMKDIASATIGLLVGVVRSTFGNIPEIVWEEAKKIPVKLMEGIGDLHTLLLDAGKQVINGLIAGIESKVNDLTGVLGDIAEKIPGPIKKVLGISSPSKVFEKIGADTIAGLVEGLKKAGAEPRDYMIELVDGMWKLASEKVQGERQTIISVGASIPDGLATGMRSGIPAIKQAAQEIIDVAADAWARVEAMRQMQGGGAAPKPFGGGAGSGGGGGGGSPDTTPIPAFTGGGGGTSGGFSFGGFSPMKPATPGAGIVVNLNVHGSLVGNSDVVAAVRDELQRGGFRGLIASPA